jgi:dolichol-phosphate mannosyltransferase
VDGITTLARASTQPAHAITGGDERPRLSIVIPTRNEADSLGRLREALAASLSGIPHEVIVVDDSTDGDTREVLSAIVRCTDGWRVIAREPEDQTGLATAVAEGIAAARGWAVCVMDGDLQHPPALIPDLLRRIEAGADIAVASRYAKGGGSAGLESGYRRLVSRGSSWAARLCFPESRRTSDPMSGFFCVRREAVSRAELRPVGFKILLELLVLFPDLSVADVPFEFGLRDAGESKAGMRQGLLYLRHLAFLFFDVPGSARPLKFACISAASLTLFLVLFAASTRTSMAAPFAWVLASAASSVANAILQRALTFQRTRRDTEPYRGLGGLGSLAGFLAYLALRAIAPHHAMITAAGAQTLALMAPLLLNLAAVRLRLRGWGAMAGEDLEQLARRLGADRCGWIDPDTSPGDSPAVLIPSVPLDLVQRWSAGDRPRLLVEPVASGPSLRRRPSSVSAIVAPAPGERRTAVLVRLGRQPFDTRDLDEAVAWAHGRRVSR